MRIVSKRCALGLAAVLLAGAGGADAAPQPSWTHDTKG
jgi:hypothetical protein